MNTTKTTTTSATTTETKKAAAGILKALESIKKVIKAPFDLSKGYTTLPTNTPFGNE